MDDNLKKLFLGQLSSFLMYIHRRGYYNSLSKSKLSRASVIVLNSVPLTCSFNNSSKGQFDLVFSKEYFFNLDIFVSKIVSNCSSSDLLDFLKSNLLFGFDIREEDLRNSYYFFLSDVSCKGHLFPSSAGPYLFIYMLFCSCYLVNNGGKPSLFKNIFGVRCKFNFHSII